MPYDLTNNKISETYGRVVQVVSGSFYDGFGNLLPIGTSSVVITASTAQFATTGSNTFIGDQIISGSLTVTNGITGSLYGTSSWAQYSTNAIYSQNAQDILIYVKNASAAIIPRGKVVRIVGADNSSNNPTVELADFLNEFDSANTLGFTNESLSINGFGYVMTEGKLLSVDTGNFTSGDLLYLSSSGNITNVTPHPPYHGVRLGQVIRSQNNNGSIYVRIDNGAELDELHNVVDTSTTSSYGDLLVKSGSYWANSRNLTGSYTLSGSLRTTNGITSSLYGTSSWANNTNSSSWSINTINVNGGYVSASGISTAGDIVPSNPSASLGTIEFPFKSINISSGSLYIAAGDEFSQTVVIGNSNGNLDISSGGIRLVQPDSSFIAPTASFSYLSSSFKQVGDRILIGNDIITGSVTMTGTITSSNIYITPNGNGRLYGTASYALNGPSGSTGTELVTGSTYPITSSWALNAVTASYLNYTTTGSIHDWGRFWDSTSQTNISGSGGSNLVTLNNTDPDSQGVSVVSGSRITVSKSGVYDIQFSMQLQKSTANPADVYIFLKKNNINVPNSTGFSTLAGNNKVVEAWNYALKLNANDYIEFYWHSDNNFISLLAIPESLSPSIPASPSMDVSVAQL